MDGKKQLDQFISLEAGENTRVITTSTLQQGLLKAILMFENGERMTQSLLVL